MTVPMLPNLLRVLLMLIAATLAHPVFAGPADVMGVEVTKSRPGVYNFTVTVRHGDQGWKHYADAWQVLGPDGAVLGTRELAHPHEHEQPFTRSLPGVTIGQGITSVRLRARDKVHGYGGREVNVDLPK